MEIPMSQPRPRNIVDFPSAEGAPVNPPPPTGAVLNHFVESPVARPVRISVIRPVDPKIFILTGLALFVLIGGLSTRASEEEVPMAHLLALAILIKMGAIAAILVNS